MPSLASLLVQKAISRAAAEPCSKAAAVAVSVAEPLLEVVVEDQICFGRSSSSKPPRTSKEEASIRSFATQATCRLLCACALAAGVDAKAVANFLLEHLYAAFEHRCGAFVVETILVPFVVHFCGPKEWAKCASVCRRFKELGIGQCDLTAYLLKGFCREGHAEVLELAVQQNVPSLLQAAIAGGADVNFAFEQLWCRTPLHRAAMRGNADMCRLILDLRANASLRDSHGAAPIHLAASRGRLSTLELLLRAEPSGAMAVDTNGRTPCHMAALKDHMEVIRRLAESRARIDAQDRAHRTPVDMARRGQFWSLVRFIEDLQEELRREEEGLYTL